MADKQFADGIYFNEPHPNAPDFVLGSISIDMGKFLIFLQKQPEEKVRLDILRSQKNDKPYIVVNDWKPQKKDEGINEGKNEGISDIENNDSLPF